jgi:peroxiredoxin
MALATGERAPDVAFRTLDGAAATLKSMTVDGPVLLAFYKVSCPVCMLALPFLERLRAAGMNVKHVTQNSPREARLFDSDYQIKTELMDPESDRFPASNAFEIRTVPSMFLVEPDGTISWSSIGFIKIELAELGERAGITLFEPGEKVPEAKLG